MSLALDIKNRFPNLALDVVDQSGDAVLYVKKEALREIASTLKNDAQFQMDLLMDLSAVDYLHWEEKSDRFELVYNLFSIKKNQRLFIKVRVSEEDASVDSVVAVWPAANWYEREVWDMFGIVFKGHPNLKRILMYEEFKGHALRKDYPYTQRQPIIGPVN